MIDVGEVRLVSTLEIGNVGPLKFHESSALQRAERLHDAGAAEVHGPEAALHVSVSVAVLRMGRPAVFEPPLCVLNDLRDGSADSIRIPPVLDERFVGLRGEQHRPRLEGPGETVP